MATQSLDDYALSRVPQDARKHWFGIAVQRFGQVSALSQFLLGATIGYSMTFGEAVLAFLFGSIITINDDQILILLALAIIVVLLYLIFRKPLYVLTFDEDTAHTAGLPVRMMSLLVSVITGVAISVVMPITGSLLV